MVFPATVPPGHEPPDDRRSDRRGCPRAMVRSSHSLFPFRPVISPGILERRSRPARGRGAHEDRPGIRRRPGIRWRDP